MKCDFLIEQKKIYIYNIYIYMYIYIYKTIIFYIIMRTMINFYC